MKHPNKIPNAESIVDAVFSKYGISRINSTLKLYFTDDVTEAIKNGKITLEEGKKLLNEISEQLDIPGFIGNLYVSSGGDGFYYGNITASSQIAAKSMRHVDGGLGAHTSLGGFEFGSDFPFSGKELLSPQQNSYSLSGTYTPNSYPGHTNLKFEREPFDDPKEESTYIELRDYILKHNLSIADLRKQTYKYEEAMENKMRNASNKKENLNRALYYTPRLVPTEGIPAALIYSNARKERYKRKQ